MESNFNSTILPSIKTSFNMWPSDREDESTNGKEFCMISDEMDFILLDKEIVFEFTNKSMIIDMMGSLPIVEDSYSNLFFYLMGAYGYDCDVCQKFGMSMTGSICKLICGKDTNSWNKGFTGINSVQTATTPNSNTPMNQQNTRRSHNVDMKKRNYSQFNKKYNSKSEYFANTAQRNQSIIILNIVKTHVKQRYLNPLKENIVSLFNSNENVVQNITNNMVEKIKRVVLENYSNGLELNSWTQRYKNVKLKREKNDFFENFNVDIQSQDNIVLMSQPLLTPIDPCDINPNNGFTGHHPTQCNIVDLLKFSDIYSFIKISLFDWVFINDCHYIDTYYNTTIRNSDNYTLICTPCFPYYQNLEEGCRPTQFKPISIDLSFVLDGSTCNKNNNILIDLYYMLKDFVYALSIIIKNIGDINNFNSADLNEVTSKFVQNIICAVLVPSFIIKLTVVVILLILLTYVLICFSMYCVLENIYNKKQKIKYINNSKNLMRTNTFRNNIPLKSN